MRERGFTLVEALIALTVLVGALLSGMGLSNFLADSRRDAVLNELLTTIGYARSQAVTLGTRITICASLSLQSCQAAAGWDRGWIVFSDPVNPGVVDHAEQILRRHGPLPGGLRLRGNGVLAGRVSFNALGTSQGFAGTFTLCDRRGYGEPPAVRARLVRLTTGGRARIVVPSGAGNCP